MKNLQISDEDLFEAENSIIEISKILHSNEISILKNELPIEEDVDKLKSEIHDYEHTKRNSPGISKIKFDRLLNIASGAINLSELLTFSNTNSEVKTHPSNKLKNAAENVLLRINAEHFKSSFENPLSFENVFDIDKLKNAQAFIDKLDAKIQLLSNQGAALENSFMDIDDKLKKLTTTSAHQIDSASRAFEKFAADNNFVLTKKVQELTDTYNLTIASLKKSEDEVSKLIGIVTSRSLAGDYEKSSVKEGNLADNFRWATIIAMIIVAGILGWTVFDMRNAPTLNANLVGRVVISLLLSVPITYLARESNKHRLMQNKQFQIALDLAALPPFLSSLSPENSEKIRTDIAGKLFFVDHAANSVDSLPINIQELINKLIDKLSIDTKK